MARTAQTGVEVGGRTIRTGARVAPRYASGDRDADAIDRPEEFVIVRPEPRRQRASGFGAHHRARCRLAELQLQVAWRALHERFREVEVVGEPSRVHSNPIHGCASLPVRLHRR